MHLKSAFHASQLNHKQLRRLQLRAYFKRERDIVFGNNSKQLLQQIICSLDQDCYQLHKHNLQLLSSDDSLSFQLLPFAPLAYDYLQDHPHDSDSLQFLRCLSQYPQIEIPQDSALITTLFQSIHAMPQSVLTLLSNLLLIPKYSQLLRDKLIQHDFCTVCRKYEQEYCVYVVGIYLQMLSSHPLLELPIFTFIYQHFLCLALQNKESIAYVFTLLSEVAAAFAPNQQLASVLHLPLRTALHHYPQFQYQFIRFYTYCERAKEEVGESEEVLVLGSVRSVNKQCREAAWHCLKVMYENRSAGDLSENAVSSKTTVNIAQCLENSTHVEAIMEVLSLQMGSQLQRGVELNHQECQYVVERVCSQLQMGAKKGLKVIQLMVGVPAAKESLHKIVQLLLQIPNLDQQYYSLLSVSQQE